MGEIALTTVQISVNLREGGPRLAFTLYDEGEIDNGNGTEMTEMKNKNATYVDVDEGVNFPLLGGPQKHRDYSTIKIDSDHGTGTSNFQ